LVLFCADATLVDPHVSIGQVSAFETIALVKKSPAEAIMRMALAGSGERLTAARAFQLGICSAVIDPPERLRDEAQALAEKIAESNPAQLAATKRVLWAALERKGA
jgi:enoyl-CoA hydratase/carnithine racemase